MEENFCCPECGSEEIIGDLSTEEGWNNATCECGHKYSYEEYVHASAVFAAKCLFKDL
ncbi:Uncharacterised protein [Cronobacter sakazakii]|nr:hypothetical protein CSK29544_00029 [Cronobacter sakazakii]SPW12821.1 Uncharacterised protein [Cronobacter sakazakii]SPW23412.1 Uncharacterised protein [Cronobacter sakazakii]